MNKILLVSLSVLFLAGCVPVEYIEDNFSVTFIDASEVK